MQLVTAAQMRERDRAAIASGIPSLQLMEAAGRALADAVVARGVAPLRIGVLLGSGNNAGDGLVAVRLLAAQGCRCHLVCPGSPEQSTPDARTNWERLPGERIILHPWTASDPLPTPIDVWLDCLLGTGTTGAVREPAAALIRAVNATGAPIIAADLPSGLEADTGQPCGAAIRAAHTVTFGLPKRGLLVGESADCVGRITVADIGLPAALVAAIPAAERMNEPGEFRPHWPRRAAAAHKHTCGQVLVVAGSTNMPGAGFLAARAALRAGAGLVTYALPASTCARIDLANPEVMFLPLPDAGTGQLHPDALPVLRAALTASAAVVLGPGLGQGAAVTACTHVLVQEYNRVPLVLDADGLNAIAADPAPLVARTAPTLLTPHPGEMARLLHTTTIAVQQDRLAAARHCASMLHAHVVLKGAHSVIAHPDEAALYLNPTGNAALATAGSGDVLAGMVAGLLAQGMPAAAALRAAVYWHGLAADCWVAAQAPRGLLASDLIDQLPGVYRELA